MYRIAMHKARGLVVRLNRRGLDPVFAASERNGAARKADWTAPRRSRGGGVAAIAVSPRAGPPTPLSIFGRISFVCRRWCTTSAACVAEWRRRARSRHDLIALGGRELSDLHLTRCDALHEARKPFWKE
jgi:uncharacterized protein YjiS (DUF1127 family)